MCCIVAIRFFYSGPIWCAGGWTILEQRPVPPTPSPSPSSSAADSGRTGSGRALPFDEAVTQPRWRRNRGRWRTRVRPPLVILERRAAAASGWRSGDIWVAGFGDGSGVRDPGGVGGGIWRGAAPGSTRPTPTDCWLG